MFTLREKSWGGLIATEECQSSVRLSLSRLRLCLWVGNICLTPLFLIIARGDGQTNDFTEKVESMQYVKLMNVKRKLKSEILYHLRWAFLHE